MWLTVVDCPVSGGQLKNVECVCSVLKEKAHASLDGGSHSESLRHGMQMMVVG